jgi:hypothetical protein
MNSKGIYMTMGSIYDNGVKSLLLTDESFLGRFRGSS